MDEIKKKKKKRQSLLICKYNRREILYDLVFSDLFNGLSSPTVAHLYIGLSLLNYY